MATTISHNPAETFAFGRALAETMRRACTEEGLWDRLAKGIEVPLGRDAMAERFLDVYDHDIAMAVSA